MCKVSPLLCPFMSSGNWSHRAHRVSKVHPKPYVGNKEFWIKLGTPKCQSTLPFRNNIAKANGSHCKREVLGQRNRGWECCIRMLQREWNKYSALWSEKEGTSEWVYFSGKKTFWKAKTPPSSPLLFNSSFWFNAQTHAEVLRYNRDEILTTLLYSITTVSNFIFV